MTSPWTNSDPHGGGSGHGGGGGRGRRATGHGWGQRPGRGPRRRVLPVGAVGALVLLAGGWLVHRAGQAQDSVAAMRADGVALREQVSAGDLVAVGATMTRLRGHAADARADTGGPVWAVAARLPLVGSELAAAREISDVVADIADAAQPLETALPRLGPVEGGRVDVDAVGQISRAMPSLAAAIADGNARVSELDPDSMRPAVADGVRTVQGMLAAANGPVADAVPTLQLLPDLLGADRPRTWLVLLQQGAEARGTGGLVGAYAVLRTDRGRIELVRAAPRAELQARSAIPTDAVPQDVRDLWGSDLTEWAGLNLSPNFPWTGRLVARGWQAGGGSPELDYVLGLDQGVVAGMLAGTGPVSVRGLTVDSRTAVPFLTREVYDRYRDPSDVDRVTAELVRTVFSRFGAGQVNLVGLVKAMATPVRERRMQLWAADEGEQRLLETMPVAGLIPDTPGPFAMAVVNNGGGNKLDAYLDVATRYEPGACAQGVRVGRITVDLKNRAPSDLPDYVDVRSDVLEVGLDALGLTRRPAPGSNRLLVDIYGPVGGQSALVTLDGEVAPVTTGVDRGHPVWRVVVPIDPAQQRTVTVVLTQPVGIGPEPSAATVLAQPMVNPTRVSVGELPPCRNPAPQE